MKRKILLMLCLAVAALSLPACGQVTPVPLEETHWLLESYGNAGSLVPALKTAPITAVFTRQGGQGQVMMQGSTGCNTYIGMFAIEGDKLTSSGSIGSGQQTCPDAAKAQGREFLQYLKIASSYRIEGQKLTINCGQAQLVFKKV
jgi:heat shock protein HslJ